MNLELFLTDNVRLLRVGGAMTGDSTIISKRFFIPISLQEKQRDIIVISTYLKEGLTPLEFKAIYYHELGHCVKQHNSTRNNSIDWKTKELEADAYAASLVGSLIVISAFEKIPNIIRACEPLRLLGTVNKTNSEYQQSLNSFLHSIELNMSFRYDALKLLKN